MVGTMESLTEGLKMQGIRSATLSMAQMTFGGKPFLRAK
jgi:hypothetical protein